MFPNDISIQMDLLSEYLICLIPRLDLDFCSLFIKLSALFHYTDETLLLYKPSAQCN